MLILDQNSENLNALQEYNREVSKRIGILKNNQNKYFARYEFDKRIKDMERERRDKIETGYRNKLKIIREKELQRGMKRQFFSQNYIFFRFNIYIVKENKYSIANYLLLFKTINLL